MQVVARGERTPKSIKRLLDVWERSVRTTQLFLLHLGIKAILAYIPLALKSASRFVIAEEEAKRLGDSRTSTAISL